MKKNVTMRDIGAALGVSTVTISKALGGKDGVSEPVRKKIIELARQMGYHYVSPAQGPDTGSIVGVLIADRFFSAPSFYSNMYKVLLRELTDAGMIGVLEIISEQDEMTLTLPSAAALQRAGGYILLGQFGLDYVTSILETGMPTVLMDFNPDGPDVDAVISDGQSGCFKLTRYLIARGHKKISFVGNIDRTTSIMDRYSGYLRAMTLAGLPIRSEWVIPDMLDNAHYLADFSFPDPLPTAFVCNNDMVACALARILRERGIRVPEDVSLTGFDDYVYGPDAIPLTTYAVDQQHMAQETVRRLVTRMREGMEAPVRIAVSGWFVERGSVADLRPENDHSRDD